VAAEAEWFGRRKVIEAARRRVPRRTGRLWFKRIFMG
jgi:hypothetical protein